MKLLSLVLLHVGLASAVGQSAVTNAPPKMGERALVQKSYQVDINFAELRHLMKAPEDQKDMDVLKNYLKQKGADLNLSPPANLFYSIGEKTLIVRSTLGDIDKLDAVFAKLRQHQ